MTQVEFQRKLDHLFNKRLRVRRSVERGDWQIEQQVGRAAFELEPPKRKDGSYNTYSDDYLRTRDGYVLVMSVRDGDRMPCERCGKEIKVPIFKSKMLKCPWCKKAQPAGMFPLGDMLIEHLWKISPEHGGAKAAADRADFSNLLKDIKADRDLSNHIEAGTAEDYDRIVGIPKTGYTGRIFTGSSGPGTE